MEPKQLTCMDEEVCIEIAKLKDETPDLIITVSMTRVYLISEPLEMISKNGNQTEASIDAYLRHSFAI